MATLSQILIDANSTLDLEASQPTGDELTLRKNYANQAVEDAAASGQLNEFKGEHTETLAASGLVTVSLPTNFRELMQDPMVQGSTGSWQPLKEIEVQEKYDYNSSDKYSYVLGNPQGGYYLMVNGVTAGDSLSVIYQRYPSGMPTLTSVCELSDPTYVTRKIESYVLYSRGDERFPIAESRAQQQLQNLMGREMKSSGGQGRSTKMTFNNPLS